MVRVGSASSTNNRLLTWIIWLILASSFFGTGLFLLALFGLPYEQARQVGDLLAKDGSLDAFTGDVYKAGRNLWSLGIINWAIAGIILIKRRFFHQVIADQLKNAWHHLTVLVSDTQIIWRKGRLLFADRFDQGVLVGIALLSIANKVVFFSKPMGHDEAYTVMAFAIRPLRALIADYHLPNNHVFHTILVHFSLFFGKQPWIVRFPAFLAGMLLIPTSYLAGRQVFKNKWVGLLSAILVSVIPVFIGFSTNARGYTLICLFTLLSWISANFIQQHKNFAGWAGLTLFSVLGFYTIPIMVYPAGMVYGWLFFSALVGDISEDYKSKWNFLKFLVLSVVIGAVMTLILYTPIFIVSGMSSLFSNSFVTSLSRRGFVAGLPVHLGKTWEEWREGIPALVVWISLGGGLTALLFHRKLTRQVFPMPLAGVIWIAALLYYQRVVPVSRVWLFALPFYLIYGAAGAVFWVDQLKGTFARPLWKTGIYSLVLITITLWSLQGTYRQYREIRGQPFGRSEQITLALCEILSPQDVILVDATNAPSFWYYFYLYDIPNDHFALDGTQFYQQVYVVVDDGEHETFDSVVEGQRFKDIIDATTAYPIVTRGALTLFRVQPKETHRISALEPLLTENHCP